jgi:hypothetical protein
MKPSHATLPLRYLKQWRKDHNGNIPANYKEKKEFKELLATGKHIKSF